MKQPYLFLLLVLLSLLTACATPPLSKPGVSDYAAMSIEEREALELYKAGDFETAAPLLEALSIRPAPASWQWQLKAADAYLQIGNVELSNELLTPLADKQMSPDMMLLYRLVKSNLLLNTFNPDEALIVLYQPPAPQTDEVLQHRYYQLVSEAYRLNGNVLESANALQELDALLLAEPEKRLENQLAIIRILATMTDTALEMLQPSPPGIQGGWMELARLIKLYGQSPDTIDEKIAVWRQQFIEHPAMSELLDGYFRNLETQYQQASHIAVLLPESGRYKNAAKAIRQGLMAAWYNQPEQNRPTLRFYDSSDPETAWPLYIEATERGADFIIGPLQKTAVSQLIHAGELPVPVLALNQINVNITPPDNFFQYSLSPEDEARQAAEHAWLNGKRQPIVLAPTGSWGSRVSNAFVRRWQSLGGQVTDMQAYNAANSDFGQPIQALLDIDQSKQRRQRVQQLLGQRVEFEPRRREDIDFIFLVARDQKARQIRPQLQFHHASNLPIYTTSHAWPGYIDIDRDRDIEGILFPDIPWILAEEGDQPLALSRFKKLLGLKKSNSLRLIAMGIDSYQLLGHLARLQSSEIEALDGKTGQLYMDRLNNIHRQLVWAQIKNSIPSVIGFAPRLTNTRAQNLPDTVSIEETDGGAPISER